jgi:hypothetical protein
MAVNAACFALITLVTLALILVPRLLPALG